MTHTETAEILRQFNEWRRGDEDIPQFDPRDIGEAIDAAVEMIDRLEAAESECLEESRLNGMGSEREAELLAKLEAAEKERDDFAQRLVQSEQGRRKAVVERDVLRDRRALESQESGALHEAVERACEERDALQVEVGKLKDIEVARCVKINGYIVDNARLAEEVERLQAKIEQMEQQEPLYLFRRKGLDDFCTCSKERYEAFSANPRLFEVKTLYALPGAQDVPSISPAALRPVIQWLRNGCDPAKAADELEMLAAAPKPEGE